MAKKKKPKSVTTAILKADPETVIKKNDRRVMMTVSAHDITVREFKIFELYCECRSYMETAKKAGICISTMYKMKNQDWWGEMVKTYIGSRQDELHFGLAKEIGTLKNSIIDIWNGKGDPKFASAIVKSMDSFSKMGKTHGKTYVEPLQQSKRELFIDNSINVDNSMNFDMNPFFHKMTAEEADKWSRDGIPPERFLKEAKSIENQNVIEVEAEEEEEDWL